MEERPLAPRLTVTELARRADVRLGEAHVSPSTRLVQGPNGSATLEPRAMQVLAALVDADGAVVTRRDLFRRCWGDAVVGDDSLNRVIADIRRALRSVGAEGVQVNTVPRTGYRLIVGKAAESNIPVAAASPHVGTGDGGRGDAGELSAHYAASTAELLADSAQAMLLGPPEGSLRAIELLERALRQDSASADAWGQLALAHAALMDMVPPDRVTATLTASQRAAHRALALAADHPDACAALAILPPFHGDWLAAERRIKDVLQRAPDHVPTLDHLAFLLVAVGRAEESALLRVRYSPRAMLHVSTQYRLIYAYWILGRVDEADRTAERALQLWPTHPAVWFARLWVLAFTGRPERALVHLEQVAARPAMPPWMLETLRLALVALAHKRKDDIDAATRRLVREVTLGPSNAINAVQLLSALGAVDDAFEVASAYLLEDGPLMASVRWQPGEFSVHDQRRRKTHLLFVPVSAALRADPRFRVLTTRCGLEDYWQQAGVTPDFLRIG